MIDDALLYEVARKYHLENKTQQEIAQEYNVARVQISKYLKRAKDKGIVNITLCMPSVSDSKKKEIQNFFKSRLSLNQLLLVDLVEKRHKYFLSHLTAEAWRLLPNIIKKQECSIGLGWGETMSSLSKEALLNQIKRPRWFIYPISGGLSRIEDQRFNMNLIIHQFSQACDSVPHPIYLPLYIENRSVIDVLSHESVYKEIVQVWDTLDVLILGIGNNIISRSPAIREQLFSGMSLNKLISSQVVGDVATHFFDFNGNLVELDNVSQFININIKQVLRVPQRIGIAGGPQKIEAIIASLKAKLITTLITDTTTACNIIDFLGDENTNVNKNIKS